MEQGKRGAVVDGIVDDFLRAYNPFYMPNAYRSPFPMDVDVLYAVKRMLVPYKFRENDDTKVEANNLAVSREQQSEINQCLKYEKAVGSYLKQFELFRLKRWF